MGVVDLHAVRKQQSLLREVAIDFRSQRGFPCAPQHDVKHGGRGGDNNQENGEQLEEDAVLQFLLYFGTSKRYPAPRTVFRYRGFSGSGSIFSRIRRT